MDNYLPLLKPFDQNICWYTSAEHYQLPRPSKGLDPKIDKICEKIDSLKDDLKKFLAIAKEQFGSTGINF